MRQIDAFARRPFEGNPAAVVHLDDWPDDALMASIAAENNLSETAFVVPSSDGRFGLRWFTPTVEVALCGHATLAAGHALLLDHPELDEVSFDTASGALVVRRAGAELELDLPAIPPDERQSAPPAVVAALGAEPPERTLGVRKVHHAEYWMAVYPSAASVAALRPDVRALGELGCNVVCTSPGEPDGPDFVSRFFAPASGVDEDPVTGSAHCTLAPYWAARTGRTSLRAEQRSPRGGHLRCEVRGDPHGPEGRVALIGPCVVVIEGTLTTP